MPMYKYAITVRFKTMLDEKAMKSVRSDMESALKVTIKREKNVPVKKTCTWLVEHSNATPIDKSKLAKIISRAGDSKAAIEIKEWNTSDKGKNNEDSDEDRAAKERDADRKKARPSTAEEDRAKAKS